MDILNKLNWVDLLVIILLCRMSYVALEDGLSRQIFPLIASVCNIVISLHFYRTLAVSVTHITFFPIEVSNFLSFTSLIIVMGLIFRAVKTFLDKIIKLSWHPVLEKVGGFIIGVVRAAVLVSMVMIIIALVPFEYFTESVRDASVTGMYFLRIGPNIYAQAALMMSPGKSEGMANLSENMVHDIVAAKADVPKIKSVREKTPAWEKALK